MLSLDLRDVFVSIHYDLIMKSMKKVGISEKIRNKIMSKYKESYIAIEEKGKYAGKTVLLKV
jgi:hypothetical protein